MHLHLKKSLLFNKINKKLNKNQFINVSCSVEVIQFNALNISVMDIYGSTSLKISQVVTQSYSTSFSLATRMMSKEKRESIYAIYGFVRLADEIVDTFENCDNQLLLDKLETDFQEALDQRISLNPILHSFQLTVHKYQIPYEYIDAFLKSMRADLNKKYYQSKLETDTYIYGSADVVGLMCLKVFCEGNAELFEKLKSPAMKLGSAFQKVNFLRDLKEDSEELGRTYFHQLGTERFTEEVKDQIISDIEFDFAMAYQGIKQLPGDAKIAVLLAYLYYRKLLLKLKKTPAVEIRERRIRIPDWEKSIYLLRAVIQGKFDLL